MEMMNRMRLVDLKTIVSERVEIPVPEKDQVLIKVVNIGVCGSDISAFYGKHPYIPCPIVLGHEFSGYIEKVGADVKNFELGTKVTVLPHVGCGKCEACKNETYNLCEDLKVIGCQTTGAHAEFVIAPAKVVFKLPDTMSMEEGAFVEPASVGYHGVKKAMIPGDNVLIMGSGTIGAFALQAAVALGAKKVIIADYLEERLELAKNLGASGVINLSAETLEEGLTRIIGSPKKIDYFCECVGGNGKAMEQIIKIARRGTRIASIGIISNNYSLPNLPDVTEHELKLFGSSMFVPSDFKDVIELMGQGKIKVDGMITHRYKLTDIKKMYEMIDSKKEKFFKIMISI